MENNIGGGFGFWAAPLPLSPPATFAPPFPATASPCSPFPDHLAVPAAGTTSTSGPHHHHHHHHLTCLKLGKRQYCGGGDEAAGPTPRGDSLKKERLSAATGGATPRCQVEGCGKALTDSKDYHRRHKVCEMHSKAPRVVVQGSEQRFCQQCSRFHGISEFDDAKRSCRRRLAGHNERRRKSNASDGPSSVMRNPTAAALENTILGSGFLIQQTSPGRALSLLSSKASPWISTPELSSRSSAALRELIAENRATLFAGQLISSSGWHSSGYSNQSIISFTQPENQGRSPQLHHGWRQVQESGGHLTLDLMQSHDTTSFELISGRNKSKEEEEECCEIWESFERTHVV